MPRTRLFVQQYKSVGFVDAGACEGADILLAKRREQSDEITEVIEQLTKAGRRMAGARLTKLREYVAGLHALLSEVDDESADSGGGKDTSMSKQFDPSALPQDAQDHIAGVEKAANDRIAAAEQKAEETAAKLAELEAKHADPEDAFKGLSDVVRKRIEDAEKAAKEAQDAAKAERDARVSAEFVAKAKAYEGKLPVKASEFGLVLKRLAEREQTDADIAEVERVLKAAAEASKLTAVLGDDNASDADPAAKIRAAADEIRKSNPALTVAQARVQARKQNPELAKAEREAERAAA